MAKPKTPAQRKKRIARDALVLLACLAVLVVVNDFPIPTAELALAATQRQELFGPGEVVDVLEYDRSQSTYWSGKYDRYYILRDGDWYAWCGVARDGWWWRAGNLEAVQNDLSAPLIPLVICNWTGGAVLVISNDPEIAEVELLFPVYLQEGGMWKIWSARETEQTGGCFIVKFQLGHGNGPMLYRQHLVVQGYGADGALRYQSPIPADWEENYRASVGADGSVDYLPLVPQWWEEATGTVIPDLRQRRRSGETP